MPRSHDEAKPDGRFEARAAVTLGAPIGRC
jgi:hypothetical protein